jgi:DNA repair protein RecO (recombination protein O)
MVKKSDRGILLKKIDYGETSLILHLYTENNGLRAFIFKGAKRKKGLSLLPLSFLEIVYFERKETNLALISEASHEMIWNQAIFDPRKSAVLFFLCDILHKTIKEEHDAQQDFFQFLVAELTEFDKAPFQANYPLYFLMILSRFLGFEPIIETEQPHYFDRREGIFGDQKPLGNQLEMTYEEVSELAQDFQSTKDQILAKSISRTKRKRTITLLLELYGFHVSNFSTPKSLKILEEVFD